MAKKTADTAFNAQAETIAQSKDAFAAAGKNAFAAFVAFNTEVLDFTQKLVNDRIATLKSAMEATSVQDVLEAETQFAQRSYASSVEHVRALGSVAQKATADTMAPLRDTMSAFVAQKAA